MPKVAWLGALALVLAGAAKQEVPSVKVGDCIANPLCDSVAAAHRPPDTIVECACASDRDPSSYQKICIPTACDSARVCRFLSLVGEDGACRVAGVHRPTDDWEHGLCKLWRPAWLMKLEQKGDRFLSTMRSLPVGWIVKQPASDCAAKKLTTAAAEKDTPLPLPECRDNAQERARDGHCCWTPPGKLVAICGAYNSETVRLAIRRQIGSLVACYQSADDADCVQPIIDFTVDSRGAVPQAAIRFRNALREHPHLRQCMVRAVRSWHFPPPSDGASVFIRYPFLPSFGEGCTDR